MNPSEIQRIINKNNQIIRKAQSINISNYNAINPIHKIFLNNKSLNESLNRINQNFFDSNRVLFQNMRITNSTLAITPPTIPMVKISPFYYQSHFHEFNIRQIKIFQNSLKPIYEMLDKLSTLDVINLADKFRKPVDLKEFSDDEYDSESLNLIYDQLCLHWKKSYDPTSLTNIKYIVSSTYYDLQYINKNKQLQNMTIFMGRESLSQGLSNMFSSFYYDVVDGYIFDPNEYLLINYITSVILHLLYSLLAKRKKSI